MYGCTLPRRVFLLSLGNLKDVLGSSVIGWGHPMEQIFEQRLLRSKVEICSVTAPLQRGGLHDVWLIPVQLTSLAPNTPRGVIESIALLSGLLC